MEPASGWTIVRYDDVARVFSAPVDNVHLLLLDEAVVGKKYIAFIRRARRRFPIVDIIVVGGPKADDLLLSERRDGVDYYFERPVDKRALAAAIRHRMDIADLKAATGIVGRAATLEEILEAMLQVAPTEVPILIEGESGTGKDVVARGIHHASRRRNGPYVAINCASLAEGVLESELFGHEKGSFTGAVNRRAGVFERADHGTIFLDEVGEMSPNMQVRLLRVLESGDVLRVGGVKSFNVDVRVVAATNLDLARAVREGVFRQDLYYRLKGVSFYLPALRERREDIPLLVDYFIQDSNRKHRKAVKGIDRDALAVLVQNDWPGNVRELRNVVDTVVVLASNCRITAAEVRGQLFSTRGADEPAMLPVALHRSKEEAEREMIYASILALHRDVREILAVLRDGAPVGPMGPLREVRPGPFEQDPPPRNLVEMERTAVADALRRSGGNRRRASEILGISERTLYRKIKAFGLG